jgi:transketolase
MRRAFSDALLQLAREDPAVIFLTGDLGFGVFDAFIAEFPERYVNVGVAEAQLVDCAAGLALEGFRPIVYSIASFVTGRAFEQIRLAVGYHGLPVVVIGAGGGYTYADAGVTHHAKEDLALMALIPNMTVVCPGDPNEVTALLPQVCRLGGPSYMRIGRFGEPRFESSTPIHVGCARLLREGQRVAVLTTGGSAVHALTAADQLAELGVRPAVCHFHTVHPIDVSALVALSGQAEVFVVVEEHGLQGGLAAAVSQWCAAQPRAPRVLRIGPSDELVVGNPKQNELQRRLGFDAAGIAAICRELWVSAATAKTAMGEVP